MPLALKHRQGLLADLAKDVPRVAKLAEEIVRMDRDYVDVQRCALEALRLAAVEHDRAEKLRAALLAAKRYLHTSFKGLHLGKLEAALSADAAIAEATAVRRKKR